MLLELHRKPDIYDLVAQPPTIEDLPAPPTSSRSIGMAVGIVMQRYAMTGERALGYLIHVSQSSNIQLRTLAEQIVDEANGHLRDAH